MILYTCTNSIIPIKCAMHVAAASPPYFDASHASHSKPRLDLQRCGRPDTEVPEISRKPSLKRYNMEKVTNSNMFAKNILFICFKMWYIYIYTVYQKIQNCCGKSPSFLHPKKGWLNSHPFLIKSGLPHYHHPPKLTSWTQMKINYTKLDQYHLYINILNIYNMCIYT